MGETIRPELSKNNKYWISKHRYYELKYFCLQYPLWKKAYELLDGLKICSYDLLYLSRIDPTDLTGKCVEERSVYFERMRLVEKASIEADPYLASYILKAVTEGRSYTYMKTTLDMPCSRDMYYDRYRRFFWLLDKARD